MCALALSSAKKSLFGHFLTVLRFRNPFFILAIATSSRKIYTKMRWDTALIDISGTICIEDQVIPGAVEALEKLRNANIRIKFVTNTTKEPKKHILDKLIDLGFKIKNDEVFTSLSAARSVIEQKHVRPFLILEESAMIDFEGIDTSNPDSVVVGLAPSKFNYQTMNKAFRLLLDGSSFIAIHKGRYYQRADGALHLGPGGFVEGLEYASGVVAEVVGKPEKKFFHEALRSLNSEPSRAVMIGDDVRDDVVGSIQAGISGMLVKTGKYRPGDETSITPKLEYVFESFPEAVEFMLKS